MKTIYITHIGINDHQMKIMEFIADWVHEKKTPVPLKEIISNMTKKEIKPDITIYSLNILVQKRYIRRAYTISNRTEFVQLRTI